MKQGFNTSWQVQIPRGLHRKVLVFSLQALCFPVCFFILYPLKYPSSLKILNLWLFDIELFEVSYPYLFWSFHMAVSRISQVPWIREQGLLYYSMYLSLYLSTPDEISNLGAKSRNKKKMSHLKITSKHQHVQRYKQLSQYYHAGVKLEHLTFTSK